MADISEIEALRPVARKNIFDTFSKIRRESEIPFGWISLFDHVNMPSHVQVGKKRARAVVNPVWTGGFHPQEWRAFEIASHLERADIPLDEPDELWAESYEEALFWAIHPDGTSDIFVMLTGTFKNVRRSSIISDAYTAFPTDRTLLREIDAIALASLFEKHPTWLPQTANHLIFCSEL